MARRTGAHGAARTPHLKHALLLAVSAAVLFAAGWTWLAFYPALPVDLGGAENLDARAQRVRIPLPDGEHVTGWYLQGSEPAAVLLLHGYGRTHTRMWRYGGFLARSGYSVLAIDFRSSAEGARRPTTLGHYELEDAQAALDWLRRRPESQGHVLGVMGESMGGSVALLLAARNPDLEAVVDDSGFATGERAIADGLTRWARAPAWPATPLARGFGRLVTGVDPGAANAVLAAARLRGRPILFIHGRDDPRVSPEQTRTLWMANGSTQPLWLVAGSRHVEAWVRHRSEYEDRVTSFLDEHLLVTWAQRNARPTRSAR